MDVTLSGIAMLVKLHPENAKSPIVVTLSGMVKVVAVFPQAYWISVVLFLLYKLPSTEQ